eukprot:11479287-Alexandrium_andersonii.AAC.1
MGGRMRIRGHGEKRCRELIARVLGLDGAQVPHDPEFHIEALDLLGKLVGENASGTSNACSC